jgi:hypothetical protein
LEQQLYEKDERIEENKRAYESLQTYKKSLDGMQ